ncbi:hypothetical protein ACQEUV_18035 [Micromonospora aurantiaca (nom. illeg.)]
MVLCANHRYSQCELALRQLEGHPAVHGVGSVAVLVQAHVLGFVE